MDTQNSVFRRTNRGALALGVILGAFLGVATSLLFPLLIVGPSVGLATAITGLRNGPTGRSRAIAGGGLLIGAGVVYLYGAVNTLIACQGQDVCGGTSVLPFLAFALVVISLGLVVEGLVSRGARTRNV
jgi:hypothetical protein